MSRVDGFRADLMAHLRAHVVGPAGGELEEIRTLPFRRYLCGVLYPQQAKSEGVHADEVVDDAGGSVGEDTADDPVTLANEWLPSSIGLSFRMSGPPRIEAEVWAGAYEGDTPFKRNPLATPDAPDPASLSGREDGRHQTTKDVLGGRGVLRCLWRPVPDGWLVTVTLVNPAVAAGEDGRPDPASCLYQVGFRCRTPDGEILDYPSTEVIVADDEDEELALGHRGARTFAIGHGTAADWSEPEPSPEWVWTETLPAFQVPPVSPRWRERPEVLSIRFLADPDVTLPDLQAGLSAFVDRYDDWIGGLPAENDDIPDRLEGARDRLIGRMRDAAGRMRRGVEALDDPEVLEAFRLANRAMGMQMRHSEGDLGGGVNRRSDAVDPDREWTDRDYAWHPFQLAFQLLVLEGLADPGSAERDVVDLIWFPTGGGKTEAYLAVAATEILLRRLRDPVSGGGTTVITRYTLRLLTSQQFQRAGTLVCALEELRRSDPARLGAEPVRIGLWVGQNSTPNSFGRAAEVLADVRDAPRPTSPFQLERCPWCGTALLPEANSADDGDYGFTAGADFFRVHCVNRRCPFHDELPVAVVDDEIYARPPTIVVGTVDKFARLAWEESAGVLFGAGGHHPPSLIIQDELHLLSGPLGTIVGLYERAIEALILLNGGRPKLVASTATIRRADDQVKRLFGREVKLFPPAGLRADHSFFAERDDSAPGRLYVGLMSQSHTAATTNVQTSAALLLAPEELSLTDVERDALWTLVSYHNTLRELGRAVTQYRDDIPEMLKERARDQSRRRNLSDESVVELTGNVGADALPAILSRLFRAVGGHGVIDVLVTTNMLSVGVDVPRLGLMLVNGQPKTTAEYIQATSRVGRSRVPGTVVTMLSPTKPRDRSHYEGFRAYHQALYRQVEPTSVTPLSLPARARALHAALVILVRHGAGLSGNRDAMGFSPAHPGVSRAVALLKQRLAQTDPDLAADAARDIDDLVEEWSLRVEACRESGRTLTYNTPGRQQPSLLRNFGASGEGWETLQSMRNVDREVPVDVIGAAGGRS